MEAINAAAPSANAHGPGDVQAAVGVGRLLTPENVAELLQVSVRWVLSAARGGELACVRVGRFPRFRPEDVRAYIERG